MAGVSLDGKQFALGGRPFRFSGVTYGTFAARPDGARFPSRDLMKQDFEAIRGAGFSVVRTYTTPTDDLLELAGDAGLHVLAGIFYPDWRHLMGASRRQQRDMARAARHEVRRSARRLADADKVLALCVGNEVPSDAVRWFGTRAVAGLIADLADTVRQEDPDRLVTYGNYPTAEYLPLPDLDFLTFNVFLEDREAFGRYLTRLHHVAGDRPLVLGETGLDSGATERGERRQAEVLDWQLAIALERGLAGTCIFSWTDDWWVGDQRVEGWSFGLTRADRSPRPALAVAERWNEATVAEVREKWPSISVVVCAHQAEATLDECLTATCALEYPRLEVIVVDDGSTDGTAAVAGRHDSVRLVAVGHGGLSAARNAGWHSAGGEIVAFLDADAWPTHDWPWFLALALEDPGIGGAGGPNLPPPDDPPRAQWVARAPGGPTHVLVDDDRAEHLPGCNMAFRRSVLEQLGGFDPVYTAAGDDVDLCWRALDAGWELGFHPSAFVWHRRRGSIRAYLRQQRGYGRAEALLDARHPERFTPHGAARWSGRVYAPYRRPVLRQRVYRGTFGAAEYQSEDRAAGHVADLIGQLGTPAALLACLLLPLSLLIPALRWPAGAALLFLAVFGVAHAAAVHPPRRAAGSRGAFRLGVALLHILQPSARIWGRVRNRRAAARALPQPTALPPVAAERDGVLVFPFAELRAGLTAAGVARLRRAGLRVFIAGPSEPHDARIPASGLVEGRLLTSAHPEGFVQLRLQARPRWGRLCAVALAAVLSGAQGAAGVAFVAACAGVDAGAGLYRIRRTARRALVQSGEGAR